MAAFLGGRGLYVLVVVAFGLGLWAAIAKPFGEAEVVMPVVGAGIIICGLVLLVPTFREGDHYERQHRAHMRAMAVAFILLGVGHAASSFPLKMALQLTAIALMIAIWLRVPKWLFRAGEHRT